MEACTEFYAEIEFPTYIEEFLFIVYFEPSEVGGFDYEFQGFQGFHQTATEAQINRIEYYPFGEYRPSKPIKDYMLEQVKDIAQEKANEYSQELVEEWDL